MARQPDIQYVQMYHYGSTARKLELLTPERKHYRLPTQQPKRQQVKKPSFTALEVCSVAVAVFMLFAMTIGLLQVGIMSSRQQELQVYMDTLTAECADLRVAYENAYDLEQVEQRALQMGLVDGAQAHHVSLEGSVLPQEPEQQPGIAEILEELFAKAPR